MSAPGGVPASLMNNARRTRTIVGTVYVVALMLAVFLAPDSTVGLVAAVGGVIVGATYVLTRPSAGGRDRSARTAGRQARRR